jgi:photosystem II stability/assembly factor-like uncharacterized protein
MWGITAEELRIFSQAGDIYSYKKNQTNIWEYENISPNPKHPISDLWGGSNVLYLVGENGFVQRYVRPPPQEPGPGPEPEPMNIIWHDSQNEKDLHGVWGSPPLLYAVGEKGAIIRSTDGQNWTDVSVRTTDHLFDVWGTATVPSQPSQSAFSQFESFAVGQSGRIFHSHDSQLNSDEWINSHWTLMNSPTSSTLLGIWGVFDGKTLFMVAVGEAGTILHYEGKIGSNGLSGGWVQQMSPTTDKLSDVWGRGANDVYAVGSNGTILHYDGVLWSRVKSEAPSSGGKNFNTIWLPSDEGDANVFIISEAGRIHWLIPIPRK